VPICRINAVTGKVGTGTKMSGYPTNRDLAAIMNRLPYLNRGPAIARSAANKCILRVSSHTPSATPAMGDGSCATRYTSRRPAMRPRFSAIQLAVGV
jgi:hypothetical protein